MLQRVTVTKAKDKLKLILQNNSSKKIYGIKIDTYINRTEYKTQRQTHVHIVN